jgi:hypothetical protein
MRRGLPWLVVLGLMIAMSAVTARQAFDRYDALRSGWSWDLAYYNQWFWALTRGDGRLSVRPSASYADEGPSVWKMNYLAPIRLAIVPLYALFPGPKTLLAVQAIVFWWCLPAAYLLARNESRSEALSATALVPLTPLLWPLAWNDFRELQLAVPFVLWGVEGYRGRHRGLATLGIGGMLACRQEFALVVASLAILRPREPEDLGRTYRWARAVVVIGAAWLLFGFFGYLRWAVGRSAPDLYIAQFEGPKAGLGESLVTAFDFLLVGLGSWAVLAVFAPRVAALALPWTWSLANGRWALRLLAAEEWHHVRYTAPMVALGLAAGLLGYARIGTWLSRRVGGRWMLGGVWLASAALSAASCYEVQARFAYAPEPISPAEAEAIWSWIRRVGPDDGVLAVYHVTAPLSSRRVLFSYILEQNKPKGYPRLGPEFRWVFLRRGDLPEPVLTGQGFERVHDGRFLLIFRRPAVAGRSARRRDRPMLGPDAARCYPGGARSVAERVRVTVEGRG